MWLLAKKFFLFIYVFLFLFNPTNFASINLLYILSAVAVFNILAFPGRYLFFLNSKYLLVLLFFLLYLVVYLLIFYFSGGLDSLYRIYIYFLVFFAVLCSLFVVVCFSRIYANDFNLFSNFLINVGVFQLLFVLLTLVFSDFRGWVLETSRIENIVSISNDYGLRSYGFANGYTSTFPMLMGLYALFMIYRVLNFKNLRISFFYDLLLFGLFILSVVLNARIGLVPVVIYVSFIFFTISYDLRRYPSFLLLALLILFIFTFVDLDGFQQYFERLLAGWYEVVELFKGNHIGTFEVLSQMLHLPDDYFHLLWGYGLSVFGEQDNFLFSSDIGFVKDVYIFGLVNTILLFFVLSYFSYPVFLYFKKNFGLFFVLSFFLSFVFYYTKGSIFAASEVYNFLILLVIFQIYIKHNSKLI